MSVERVFEISAYIWFGDILKCNVFKGSRVGLAIFDTTREPGTNTTRKNRVWVYYNRVRVITRLKKKKQKIMKLQESR
jgi:hypothetical protein